MAFRKHEFDPTSSGSRQQGKRISHHEHRHERQESGSALGSPLSPSQQHRPALPISSLLSPAPPHHRDRPSPASGSTSSPTSDDLSDGELPPSPFRPPQGSPTKTVAPASNMKAVARPYRSHSRLSGLPLGQESIRPANSDQPEFPACSRCHKRRSRCTIEIPGQPCLLCRMHGVPCSSATSKSLDKAPRLGFVRRSLVSDSGDYATELNHVVGPIISRDTQILEQYLPPNDDHNDDPARLRSTASHPTQNAIYHAPAPRRRASPSTCACSQNLAAELSERVDSYVDKLVALYFEHLHPCFPLVQEECVTNRVAEGTLFMHSPHYAANLYAYTLFYAELSPALAPYVLPE